MLKRIVKIVLVLLLISIPIFAEINYETEYNLLMIDYEETINDYEQAVDDLRDLNVIYKSEVYMHTLSKEQIETDQLEITMLRDDLEVLLKLVDPRYFTVFLMGGQDTTFFTGELAFSADVPKLPISAIISAQYTTDNSFNVKLGIGIKF